MRNIIPLVMGAALLAAIGPARGQAPPQSGKVIVLENERTMTGDVERDGDRYRIRRLTGEVSVPASRVLRVCASLDEAYLFLRGRAALNDPDERLRLAEWCRQHHLKAQAIAELEAALQLRPEDARLRRILAGLKGSAARNDTEAKPAPTQTPVKRPDIEAGTRASFAVKVQPILMNRCANCHCGDKAGAFHLKRAWSSGSGDRPALEHNIAAVVAWIDPRQPEASKLLRKAVSVHADNMATAPLSGKQMAAFKTLEKWVRDAVAANPGLKPAEAPPAAVAVTPAPPPPATRFGDDRPAPKPMAVEKPPASDEPGSPDEFNRENHPAPVPAPAPRTPPQPPSGERPRQP